MGARKRFGVVGHHVAHSLSPEMHNAVFRKLGIDHTYEAFDVDAGELGQFVDACRCSDFIGLNVTIPYKVDVMKYLDSVSENAQLIGAVNTIKFVDSDAHGYNTDGIGCVKALNAAGVDVDEKKVLVIGAGGAARAIVFQCLLDGAHVCISNRSMERAVALGGEIKKRMGKRYVS